MDRLLPIAARAGALLKARGETIAVAESSAGGLVSAALLAVPGASAYFLGGTVVYTRAARETLLAIRSKAPSARLETSEPWSTRSADSSISLPICWAASDDRSASLRTSPATMEKPTPCSPARAASTPAPKPGDSVEMTGPENPAHTPGTTAEAEAGVVPVR